MSTTDYRVELLTTAAPIDITDDVMTDDPISIDVGRSGESGQPEPLRLAFKLKDYDGKYDPANPNGPYYGLIGRNTPVAVSVLPDDEEWPQVIDSFSRTVAAGWGTSTSGHAWTPVGSGGSVLTTDWSVSGGAGIMTLTSAGSSRSCRIRGGYAETLSDYDATVSVVAPVATGDRLEVQYTFRGVDADGGYSQSARMALMPSGAVDLYMIETVANVGTVYGPVTVSGLTHTGQSLRFRARCVGWMTYVKVWETSGVEPDEWHGVWQSNTVPSSAGVFSVRSGRSIGNTNSPAVFAYDNLIMLPRSVRAVAEIQSWPLDYDAAGALPVVSVEAAGALRRLTVGSELAVGPLTRALSAAIAGGTGPVGYWPMEEGATSMVAGQSWAAVGEAGPLTLSGGQTQSQLVGNLPGTAPLPRLGDARASASLAPSTSTGGLTMWASVIIPDAGITSEFVLLSGVTTGTAARWELSLLPGGGISGWNYRVRAYSTYGTLLLDYSSVLIGLDYGLVRITLELTQDGSDIDYVVAYAKSLDRAFILQSATVTGSTVGAWSGVSVSGSADNADVACGHVTLWNEVVSIFVSLRQFLGYAGETPAQRVQRICNENGIPAAVPPAHDASMTMGVQPSGTALAVLTDAAAVGGILVEDRGTGAVMLAPREYLYAGGRGTAPVSWAHPGHIPSGTRTSADRSTFRNRVSITRAGGGAVVAEQASGPLGTAAPPTGSGICATSITLGVETDAQAADQAAWRLNAALADSPRFNSLTMRLHSATDISAAHSIADAGISFIEIADIPRRLSPAGSQVSLPVGRSERIGPNEWRLTHILAAAEHYRILTLDDDTLGRADTAGASLDGAIDADDTTIYVATSTGPLWTTDPSDMPVVIDVDGEPIEVTAISGATSPQEFTVTRANAVAVAHPSGAAVTLWRAPRLGL